MSTYGRMSYAKVERLLAQYGDEANVRVNMKRFREGKRDHVGIPSPVTFDRLSQRIEALGRHANKSTLWKIENDEKVFIPATLLLAIATALEVTIADLLLPEGLPPD